MRKHLLLAAVMGVFISPAAAQDPAADDAERTRRGAFLQSLYQEFDLTHAEAPQQPLTHMEKPLLRYSNPVRNFFSDGCTYFWLDGTTPVAAATFSIRGEGKLWGEFSSLSASPVICKRNDDQTWAPEASNIVRRELKKSPAPTKSARLRLVQFRAMARRFRVLQRDSDANRDNDMRMLDQPIYRWEDARRGVVDGAVFAFCETTDPETLLMMEVVQAEDDPKPYWRYTIARSTSRPLKYYLDGELVLELMGYWRNPRTPKDPYVEQSLGTYDEQN